jgi:hypothetical protein
MKKTTLTADAARDFEAFFDDEAFPAGQIALGENAALQKNAATAGTVFLDNFLTAIKFIFLYLPGATAIHFNMLGFALLFYYDVWSGPLLLGAFGIFAFATFMIMLGIGKFFDLKYLRVVLAVAATSFLSAVLYSLLILFIPGDFFGLFAKITLPVTFLAGFLVKRKLDRENPTD